MFGVGTLGSLGVGTWGGGVTYSPQALALFARFTTPPTTARKALINNLIVSLIASGVWAKLDALYMTAAADSQAARQNWVQNLYNLSAVNSPTFTADRGYAGDGSSSYLRTNFNPATAVSPKFVQDSSHSGVSDRTTRAAADVIQIGGWVTGVSFVAELGTRAVGDVTLGRVNQSSTLGVLANANSAGRFLASRTGSTTTGVYRNGASLGATGSPASVAIGNIEFYIGAINQSGAAALFSSDQLSQASIGGGLDATAAAALDSALATYLTAVGA